MLRSLFGDEERRPLSVTELNEKVQSELERTFPSVWVEGEIVSFNVAASGHWYFNLRDGTSQLKAACYRGSNYKIRFKPMDGLQVRVRGRLTLYAPRGEYQILVESLEPVGEGARKVAYEQIKARLEAEGLFSAALKRPIPFYPRTVGVVTSSTGAAFFDILHVISRRARTVNIVLIPSRVQGENAAEEIALAIRAANEYSLDSRYPSIIDVLIVGRGGGSREDLWSFNEEIVARAIRASAIPVISAVGHEIDNSIADLVADLRAPTPSAAAEIVVQREDDIINYLNRSRASMKQSMEFAMLSAATSLNSAAGATAFRDYPSRLVELSDRLDRLASKAADRVDDKFGVLQEAFIRTSAMLTPRSLREKAAERAARFAVLEQRHQSASAAMLANAEKGLELASARLDALSPLAILGRGYSLTRDRAGNIVRRAGDVCSGDKINIRLSEGSIEATVDGSGNG